MANSDSLLESSQPLQRLLARLSVTDPDTYHEDGYDIDLVFKNAKHMLGMGTPPPASATAASFGQTEIDKKIIKLEETVAGFMQRLEAHITERANQSTIKASITTFLLLR